MQARVPDLTYERVLAEAWAAHLRPKGPRAPTVVTTFAGGGGSSLGYSMAGYRCCLAVEWDAHAVATYRLNFPKTPVYHGDIAKLSVEECLARAGLGGPGELDVLDGSPPCQGFSTAGKRQMDDPRNGLFREYVRLLRGLRPRAFVMENVSGMVKGKMLLVFREALQELKACGYRAECRLMDAKWFCVPQTRQRIIIVGVRDDLGAEPSHPKAQRAPYTVADACPWLWSLEFKTGPRGPAWNPYNKRFDVGREPVNTIPKSAARADGEGLVAAPVGGFTSGWNAGKVLDLQRNPAPCVQKGGIDGSSSSSQFGVTAAVAGGPAAYLPAPPLRGKSLDVAGELRPGQAGDKVRLPGKKDSSYRDLRMLDGRAASPTVMKHGSFNGQPRLVAPAVLRGLSIGEVRRLSSFPDAFVFPETGKARKDWELAWARLGNSVPPLFMRAVAAHVRAEVLGKAAQTAPEGRQKGQGRRSGLPEGARGGGAP